MGLDPELAILASGCILVLLFSWSGVASWRERAMRAAACKDNCALAQKLCAEGGEYWGAGQLAEYQAGRALHFRRHQGRPPRRPGRNHPGSRCRTGGGASYPPGRPAGEFFCSPVSALLYTSVRSSTRAVAFLCPHLLKNPPLPPNNLQHPLRLDARSPQVLKCFRQAPLNSV
jgi:hypothetical protein